MSYITDFPTFRPTSFPGCVLWLRADEGITVVQGPVVATGTTPPTVTFTGTPTNIYNSTIIITITLAGIVGTAQFSWSLNGNTQQTAQTVISTFLLGTTGITANFSAGTYNTASSADTYTSVLTISQWNDLSGYGNNAVQVTAANQPTYTTSDVNWNGKSSITFAAGQFMSIANSASLQIINALTLVAAQRSTDTSGLNTIISKGVSGIEFDSYYSSGASPKLVRGGTNQLEGTPIIAQNTTTSIIFTTDQSFQQAVYHNGASVSLQANTFGAGTSSSNAVRIGERSDGSTQFIGSAVEYMIFNTYLNPLQIATLNSYQKVLWGVP